MPSHRSTFKLKLNYDDIIFLIELKESSSGYHTHDVHTCIYMSRLWPSTMLCMAMYDADTAFLETRLKFVNSKRYVPQQNQHCSNDAAFVDKHPA